jgi:hypothetical protein
MSDIWAAVASTLAADPHLGVDAVWTSREGGAPVPVRVVLSRPEEAFGLGAGPGAPRGAGIRAVVMMPVTALPGRPARFDLISFAAPHGAYGIEADLAYQIATVTQDSRGSSHLLTLQRIP